MGGWYWGAKVGGQGSPCPSQNSWAEMWALDTIRIRSWDTNDPPGQNQRGKQKNCSDQRCNGTILTWAHLTSATQRKQNWKFIDTALQQVLYFPQRAAAATVAESHIWKDSVSLWSAEGRALSVLAGLKVRKSDPWESCFLQILRTLANKFSLRGPKTILSSKFWSSS